MRRFTRPHVAPRARDLTLQTAQRARRAKWELAAIVPLLALTIAAYVERERIFGVDAPVRVAAAVVMVVLGWALARDLGRFSAPALFRHMDPATAGTVGQATPLSNEDGPQLADEVLAAVGAVTHDGDTPAAASRRAGGGSALVGLAARHLGGRTGRAELALDRSDRPWGQ